MSHATHASDPFADLYHDGLRLLLCGGKGGVGKTTVAAACALSLAERYPHKRFLVLSTDPAHSLADSFAYPLGTTPTPVYGRANLVGLEIDTAALFARFRAEHGQSLKQIVGRGTYLDEEDLTHFLALSFPGLDEMMALFQIMDLVQRAEYDLIMVDTAPTGHTLRLLDLPVLMRAWTAFLDTLMAKHRYLARLYTRAYRRDEADAFINTLAGNLQRLRHLLQDEKRCRFVPITLAEPVVLAETHRLLEALAKRGLTVQQLLVNQVMINAGTCALCGARAETQRRHLEAFGTAWPALSVVLLPASPLEVKGEAGLRTFLGRALYYTEELLHSTAPALRRAAAPPVCLPTPPSTCSLFLFCGKGGVGKTTLASAFALRLSSDFPEQNILLFSTDPAHSLADCLGQPIGPQVTRVADRHNLCAVEIDPAALFRAFKQAYAQQIADVFAGFSQRTDLAVRFDQEVLTDLLDLVPPGLDELMALVELADYMQQDRYDRYVLDTAPTGHTLRFLELPDLVQDWLRAFFEIILKYRTVVRLPQTSQLLIELSQKVKRIQRLFSDATRCACFPVTIPTTMALQETQRLVAALRQAQLPLQHLLVNRVATAADACDYCQALAQEHARTLQHCKATFPELDVVLVPEVADELKGPEALSGLIRFG
jgi:arsenite-transporting ATPase